MKADRPNRTPEHAALCRRYAEQLIEPLREVAKAQGYALAVHGSLAYDIDLIACPWSKRWEIRAVAAPVLAEAIRQKAEELTGYAYDRDRHESGNPEHFADGCPGAKPHGRRCWTFYLDGGPYIDLSVMPRREDDS